MTNEEFENRRKFFLEKRAQFAADMGQLHEAQAQTERVVAQIAEIVARLANRILEGSNDFKAKINALVDSQKRTREDLKNLIAALKRHLSERRKGN